MPRPFAQIEWEMPHQWRVPRDAPPLFGVDRDVIEARIWSSNGWNGMFSVAVDAEGTPAKYKDFESTWRNLAVAHVASVHMLEIHYENGKITNESAILRAAGLQAGGAG